MSNLDQLRDGGVAHPTHKFSDDEMERIESLSDEEVAALVAAKQKLGHDLCTKTHDGDDDNGTHPNTLPI